MAVPITNVCSDKNYEDVALDLSIEHKHPQQSNKQKQKDTYLTSSNKIKGERRTPPKKETFDFEQKSPCVYGTHETV